MSILRLNKVTLLGLSTDRSVMLAGLQEMGCVHLIPLQQAPLPESDEVATPPAENAYQALRWVMNVPKRRRQVREDNHFDFDEIVRCVLNNKQQVREALDQRAFLNKRIEEITPWGHFRLPATPKILNDVRLWFYQIPVGDLKNIVDTDHIYEEVYRDNRFSYIIILDQEEPILPAIPIPRSHIGTIPLKELQQELERTEILLENLEAKHQELSQWIYLLNYNLARAEDCTVLIQAEQGLWEQGELIILQGWVAQRNLRDLEIFAEQNTITLIAEEPAYNEAPPTLLENPTPINSGQDLVSFYQTPAYSDWDPSCIVFLSFAIFFSMIIADAGYALVLALVLIIYWNQMGKSNIGQRFRLLSSVVLSSSVIYGTLVGSYFGIILPEESLLTTLKILKLDDFDTMMQLSICIGCLHLIIANAAIAIRIGYFPENARPLGWIVIILGGLSIWIGNIKTISGLQIIGYLLLSIGLLVILLFASRRPVTNWLSAILRLFDGLAALTQISTLFGDILSYLRLFALGLASSSLAMTFNQLATQVREDMPGVGLLIALFIIILGHSINLILGIMSGFVHGLRLNFIEFFKWGLSDEGYPFRPFAKKEVKL